MQRAHFIDVTYTQTEGEPTCIVHSGILYPAGADIFEKRRFLEKNFDWLRRSLMREPRGHNNMFGVFVTPPSEPGTDAGMIWIDGERFVDMCGHGTIALGMAMVAGGLVPRAGEITTIRFETTVGLVTAEVKSNGRRVEWTRFENVPAYVAAQDVSVELPGYGGLKADIAFGGNFFAAIEWLDPDLKICPENGSRFAELGLIAKKQLREKVKVLHPVQSHINDLNFVTFYHEPERADSLYRSVHVFSDGKLDRSPGGTGTSAMMAILEARGRIKLGQTIKSEGLLGSGQFEGCLVRETTLGNQRAVVPTIKGRANIIGYAKWLMDPEDLLSEGFVIR